MLIESGPEIENTKTKISRHGPSRGLKNYHFSKDVGDTMVYLGIPKDPSVTHGRRGKFTVKSTEHHVADTERFDVPPCASNRPGRQLEQAASLCCADKSCSCNFCSRKKRLQLKLFFDQSKTRVLDCLFFRAGKSCNCNFFCCSCNFSLANNKRCNFPHSFLL